MGSTARIEPRALPTRRAALHQRGTAERLAPAPRRSHRFGYLLPFDRTAGRDGRLEAWGSRYWPRVSAGYLLVARKRVYTYIPSKLAWSRKRAVVGGLVEPMTRAASPPPSRERSAA
jgi:hypothetical protein